MLDGTAAYWSGLGTGIDISLSAPYLDGGEFDIDMGARASGLVGTQFGFGLSGSLTPGKTIEEIGPAGEISFSGIAQGAVGPVTVKYSAPIEKNQTVNNLDFATDKYSLEFSGPLAEHQRVGIGAGMTVGIEVQGRLSLRGLIRKMKEEIFGLDVPKQRASQAKAVSENSKKSDNSDESEEKPKTATGTSGK